MAVEFVCCECKRTVVAVVLEVPPEPPLCAHCLHIPGWFEDADLRRIFGMDEGPPAGRP